MSSTLGSARISAAMQRQVAAAATAGRRGIHATPAVAQTMGMPASATLGGKPADRTRAAARDAVASSTKPYSAGITTSTLRESRQQQQMARRVDRLRRIAHARAVLTQASAAGVGDAAPSTQQTNMNTLRQAVREAAQPAQPIAYGERSYRGVEQQAAVAARGDEAARTAASMPHASQHEMAQAGVYEKQKAEFRASGQQKRMDEHRFEQHVQPSSKRAAHKNGKNSGRRASAAAVPAAAEGSGASAAGSGASAARPTASPLEAMPQALADGALTAAAVAADVAGTAAAKAQQVMQQHVAPAVGAAAARGAELAQEKVVQPAREAAAATASSAFRSAVRSEEAREHLTAAGKELSAGVRESKAAASSTWAARRQEVDPDWQETKAKLREARRAAAAMFRSLAGAANIGADVAWRAMLAGVKVSTQHTGRALREGGRGVSSEARDRVQLMGLGGTQSLASKAASEGQPQLRSTATANTRLQAADRAEYHAPDVGSWGSKHADAGGAGGSGKLRPWQSMGEALAEGSQHYPPSSVSAHAGVGGAGGGGAAAPPARGFATLARSAPPPKGTQVSLSVPAPGVVATTHVSDAPPGQGDYVAIWPQAGSVAATEHSALPPSAGDVVEMWPWPDRSGGAGWRPRDGGTNNSTAAADADVPPVGPSSAWGAPVAAQHGRRNLHTSAAVRAGRRGAVTAGNDDTAPTPPPHTLNYGAGPDPAEPDATPLGAVMQEEPDAMAGEAPDVAAATSGAGTGAAAGPLGSLADAFASERRAEGVGSVPAGEADAGADGNDDIATTDYLMALRQQRQQPAQSNAAGAGTGSAAGAGKRHYSTAAGRAARFASAWARGMTTNASAARVWEGMVATRGAQTTWTPAPGVYGEGFTPHRPSRDDGMTEAGDKLRSEHTPRFANRAAVVCDFNADTCVPAIVHNDPRLLVSVRAAQLATDAAVARALQGTAHGARIAGSGGNSVTWQQSAGLLPMAAGVAGARQPKRGLATAAGSGTVTRRGLGPPDASGWDDVDRRPPPSTVNQLGAGAGADVLTNSDVTRQGASTPPDYGGGGAAPAPASGSSSGGDGLGMPQRRQQEAGSGQGAAQSAAADEQVLQRPQENPHDGSAAFEGQRLVSASEMAARLAAGERGSQAAAQVKGETRGGKDKASTIHGNPSAQSSS